MHLFVYFKPNASSGWAKTLTKFWARLVKWFLGFSFWQYLCFGSEFCWTHEMKAPCESAASTEISYSPTAAVSDFHIFNFKIFLDTKHTDGNPRITVRQSQASICKPPMKRYFSLINRWTFLNKPFMFHHFQFFFTLFPRQFLWRNILIIVHTTAIRATLHALRRKPFESILWNHYKRHNFAAWEWDGNLVLKNIL